MNKEQLGQYYDALHYALDREMVDRPPVSFKALKKACSQLEKRLERCPNGNELISEARDSIIIQVC